MKYPSFNKAKSLVRSIEVPKNGICLNELTSTSSLNFAKNMIFENGRLVSRKGFNSREGSLLEVSTAEEVLYCNFELTDAEVNIKGYDYRIAIAKVEQSLTSYDIFVFGVMENRITLSLGNLSFPKMPDTFYCPEKIHFYSGKPQIGNGIFALVSLRDKYNSYNTSAEIYEVGSTYKSWLKCDNFYIPTVYVNGRGNAYRQLDWNFAEAPKRPQGLNMLSGKFYAYYSSDGYSSNFALPYTNIDNKMVVCRVYHSVNQYTQWTIFTNETTATQTVYGATVTANIDRERGLLYFTSSDGSAFAIPAIEVYSQNNIRIMAEKTVENGFFNIANSSSFAACGQKRIFSGGKKQNEIYYTDYENPLYFPEVLGNTVGFCDTAVKKLKVLGERIVAFKEIGIYDIKVKNGNIYYKPELLSENGAVFKETATFTVSTVSDNMGCNYFQTITAGSRGFIWRHLDGKIYLLNSKGNDIECISHNIEDLMSDFGSEGLLLATAWGENYVLYYNQKMIIIDKNNASYYWELPPEINAVGFISRGKELSMLYRYGRNKYCYLAEIRGDEDKFINGVGNSAVINNFPIESEMHLTSPLGKAGTKATVSRMDLKLYREGKCEVAIGDGNLEEKFSLKLPSSHGKSTDTLQLITDLSGLEYIKLSIKSNKGISFSGADIYCNEYQK